MKGYFADCSDDAAAARTAGVPEALFYRHRAIDSGVRTLDCFYSEVDPVSRHGLVITGDVAAQGGIFLDAMSPYSTDQVAQSLEQYAILHGRTWGEGHQKEPWLMPRLRGTMRARGLPEIRRNFEGSIGSGIPDEVRDAERLFRAIDELATLLEAATTGCLLHGDAHVGNIYLDAYDRPCLLDWQLVQRGPWFLDVGYHIACTLSTAERRKSESDLLAHYLDRLRHETDDAPLFDDAWHSISMGMVYGFFLWAITLKMAAPITKAMLQRLGNSVADHNVYTLFESKRMGIGSGN